MSEKFRNLHPHDSHGLREVVRWKLGSRHVSTEFAPPIAPTNSWRMPGDQACWVGHSTFLVSAGGCRIMTDPVFSKYCAPIRIPRLRRKAPPGIAIDAVGPLSAVLITHNHYDHLDRHSILALPPDTFFMLPMGLGKWFEKLGRRNYREMAWGETASVDWGRIWCVPSQHFSSRTLWDRDRTLWCGWVIEAGGRRMYAAGDTGYAPIFTDIGRNHGPMDLALIPIGAYEPQWFMKPMHVNPEEALQVHLDVRSRKSIAGHWGTFCLTDELMAEPPARLRAAMLSRGIDPGSFVTAAIGESIFF